MAATVTVTAVLIKAQTPRPAKITQGDPQRVIWETTAYLQTPYPVEKQTLKVQRIFIPVWFHAVLAYHQQSTICRTAPGRLGCTSPWQHA